MLQFEVRRGLRARGDLAIDDVSMSPECFGLNVPPNETVGYDYDNFDVVGKSHLYNINIYNTSYFNLGSE